ncbi:hypothetical protein H0H87_003335 [Tephrocybe sp. NHM501043]|nr:hypothetical protein H0H87_003335 [Tephrocybe sp. NHM501043]
MELAWVRLHESLDVLYSWSLRFKNVAIGEDNAPMLVFDRLVLLKPLSRGTVYLVEGISIYLINFLRSLISAGPLTPGPNIQTEDDFFKFVNDESQSE